MITALYKNGVNVIRMNFSHKDYEEKKRVIDIVRKLNKEDKTKLSLLLDNKGPEIRTGKKETKTQYEIHDEVKITINPDDVWERDIFCDYPYLLEDLAIGDIIKIDSWLFDVQVTVIEWDHCKGKALNSALIWSYRHINLPGKKLKLPALTDQDKEDLLFGIQHKITIIAMSFVRSADHIKELRSYWKENGWETVHIIAKIENQEGIDHLDEIIQESDGIMVARWDLGIEVPITLLPFYQQRIVDRCHEFGKPVIIATQMIESMIKEPFPTRAEINDIYQAVMTWADCTMLSGETAIGEHPIQALQFMRSTIQSAELYKSTLLYNYTDQGRDTVGIHYKQLLKSALYLAKNIDAAALVLFTKSWAWAKLLSSYKSKIPIIACTRDQSVLERLGYYYGVVARMIEGKPEPTYDWILSQCPIINNTDNKPFIVVWDTDTIHGHYPTIQIIKKSDLL